MNHGKCARWIVAVAVVLLIPSWVRAEEPGAAQADDAIEKVSRIRGLVGKGAEAVPALREALKDPSDVVRAAAVQILAKEGGASAIPDIAPLVSDPEDVVAIAAVRSLVGIGGDGTLEPIRLALGSSSSKLRVEAASYVGDARDGRFVAELGRLVSDPVPDVRKVAVGSLHSIGTAETTRYLLAATTDSKPDIAAAAVAALEEKVNDVAVLKRVAALATSEATEVRRVVAHAIIVLGGFGSERETVDRLLADPQPDVRIAVITGLRDHPSPGAIPLLAQQLSSPNVVVRRQSVQALKLDTDPAALPALARFLADTDPSVRANAVLALASRSAPDADATIGALKSDPSEAVRSAVATAFGDLRRPEGLTVLRVLVADKSSRVRGIAAQAAGKIGTSRCFEVLDPALADKEAIVRIEAVRALGGVDLRDALPRLRRALKDSDPKVKIEAIGQVGTRKDEKAVPALRRALSDPSESVRKAARAALDRIQAAGTPATPPGGKEPKKSR